MATLVGPRNKSRHAVKKTTHFVQGGGGSFKSCSINELVWFITMTVSAN